MNRRRWLPAVLAIAGFGCLGVLAAQVAADWRFDDGLARAKREAAAGRFDVARAWLLAQSPGRLDDPDAADLLGVCEHVAGRYQEALAAWRRIPPGSPRSARVALARARTLIGDLGRYAEAEPILEQALRDADASSRLEIRHTLSQLYFTEFRPEAQRRLTRGGWRDWRDPAAEIRDLWLIDDAVVLLDQVRATVDAAARLAPDDDRVWLSQAGLDLEVGRLDDAARRLDACLARRPDDPAVWLAVLRRARAAGDAAAIRRALEHLPADALDRPRLLEIRAAIAAIGGDAAEERRCLEARAAIGPAEPAVYERLAALAVVAGRTDQVVALRRRKTEIDDAKDRYRRLMTDAPPSSGFENLADLAAALGRPFEAAGWRMLAAPQGPSSREAVAALVRIEADQDRPTVRGTLADRLATLFPSDAPKLAERSTAAPAPTTAASDVRFVDDAGAAGLRFILDNGRSPQRQLPETTAGGLALLDYDGDGWLDVYAVQGGEFPPDPARAAGGDRLFRNRRDGTFEDVTERSGLAKMPGGYGHGVAVGDVDNDGRPDLFVTRWRSYALYRNKGDGTFEDYTAAAGLGGDRDWPTSAAFADLDNDGDLDLYVCHYLKWDEAHPTLCPRGAANGPRPDPEVVNSYCVPHPFPALPDHLFRNDGGKFVDVTAEAGIVDLDGRGLGVVAADVDDDGLVDLFVANDTTANYLFHNKGGLKFEEVGLSSGVACNAQGAYQAGMGVACGDVDGDGRVDLLVTNFYGESTSYFRNLGRGMFTDATASSGLGAATRFVLGFGLALVDVDDDGRARPGAGQRPR